MNIHKIPLADTHQFSSLLVDYIQRPENFQPFHRTFPTVENFAEIIGSRTFDSPQRERLHRVLSQQYGHIYPFPQAQIDILRHEKTFTVTTGHQLNIFGGPMYLMYKLVTVINLARKLQASYPDYHFVPMYWMATEDHDFEEINHFHLFGKKYAWQTEQTGAVGRMNPRELETLFKEIPDKLPLFEKAYLENRTLADATRHWVHELFGEHGLLCLDADHPELKALFLPVMRQDVLEHQPFERVNQASAQLSELRYKMQIHPREINLFYLDHGLRERIVETSDGYQVLNTDIAFSRAGLLERMERHPEQFSPNVILRPVYQEMVLPNLAYVGGPAEIAYWLQLKSMFDALHVSFPLLVPRNFALIINHVNARKFNKLNITPEDLFQDENQLKRTYVTQNVPQPVDTRPELEMLDHIFASLQEKAIRLDKSLEGFIGAERQKMLKVLENIDKRLKRAEEQKQETGIGQLLSLKAKLFPEGELQERVDNFLNFYLNDPDFLDRLLRTFDPLDFRFYVLTDDDQS